MKDSGNYTVINDDRIDVHIKKDLDIIVEEILNEIEHVDCILLGGGFGRGEGSVIVTESKIQPVNDYDIYVITELKPDFNKINLIRSKLITLIKIRQIDIDFKTKNELRNRNKSVSEYDLKYASKLIYGDSKVLDIMPGFKPEEINLSESLIPVNLYLISIIQSFPFENSQENNFWGKQQISKSILGWSMAILVSKGKYHPSYSERQKIFRNITDNNDMIDLVDFATDFKLKPVLDSKIDWKKLWDKNLNIHMSVLYDIYSKNYNKKINNIFDVIGSIKNNYINVIKKIIGYLTGKKFYINRENLVIIELLILSYINEINNTSSTHIYEIENELKKRLSISEINIKNVLEYCIENDINCAVWKERGNKIYY